MNFDKYIHRHWNTTFEKMSKSEVPTGAMGMFEITTFVHPHLFWLIEVESKIRQKTLHELDTSMKELCKQQSRDSATTFEAGDIVIVQYEGHLYRAILEYIGEQKSCSNGQYLCWLMDYGTLVESNTIFKSSPKIRKILPLSFQASLNNVVYTIQHLGFGETGNVVTKTEYLLSPTPPCHQASMDVLKTVRTIEFCVEEKDEGILFGDVIYKDKNGNKKSFKQYLLDKGIVGISEELFPDMKSFINEYREKNIQLIEKICKTSSNTISRRKACCDIKKKSIEEFEEVEISEEEMRRPRRRIRDANETDSLKSKSLSESNSSVSKSSRSHGNEQLDSFNTSPGQEDVSSQHELSSQAPSLSKSSKMAILRKKIEEKKANQKENTTLESSSSSGKGQGKCKITDVNKESGGKIELCPAGAERTFFGAQGVEKPKPTSETKPQSLNNRRSKPQATVPVSMETHQRRCAAQNGSPDSSTDSSSECKNNIANTFGDQSRKGLNYDGESLSLESKTSTSVSIRSASNMEIKPHCRCKVCDRWTKDQGWGEGGEFEKYKPKVKLIGESKHEFLKEGTDDAPSEILSVDYNSLTRLEKKAMPKLLVHSECLPSPVKELANVYLHPDIYQTLVQEECKVTRLVQTYAWPALLRNQHVFMVNGPHTGKTTAYLTTMCSFLVEKDERYSFTKKLSGAPIIVILCSNTERCRDVNDRARLIMGRNKARIELVEYPISHVNTTHIDMLITTPTIFVDLLKRRSVILNGLCHLVFEDGDNILNHYYPLIDIILEQTHKMLKNRHHSKSLQLIMCAEHWTKKITCVLQKLAAIPVVCIANYLEAAMYGKIQFSMRFMRSSAKPEMMKRLLKDTYKFTKSVIICNIAEVDELETTLIMSGIEAAVISEKLTVDETHLIEENWTKAPGGNYTGRSIQLTFIIIFVT
ncbi:unnamed protein product [Acanthoscelides obtectus]|uniref:RNA helicase n=1 Tax=Acanthoscelides obtectus TaxID=200917 RepID=A0A9P0LH50_ACAOB|nr:unnamed protein product [Acanthoscelides obtectus]CAK1650757.1 Putative ATP-dependent RNA helicase TDRD12 [Acanthoscelides obtectus]